MLSGKIMPLGSQEWHGCWWQHTERRTDSLTERICNDMDTSRPIEAAFELVLGIIAKYAPSLPVVLVGTKKDKFLRQETELSKEEIRALETGRAPEPQRELDIARDLQKRQSWQKRLAIDCADANDKLDIKVTFVSRGKNTRREHAAACSSRRRELLASKWSADKPSQITESPSWL